MSLFPGDIEAAAARMAGHIRRTPLLSSPFVDALAGRRVLVKAECLQHTGSFKARGGWSALSTLTPEARARGVIAYSSGNHAQGVAAAARAFGAPAVIVMPADAPRLKIDNTRTLGAEVVLYDRATEDRDAIGAALAAKRGLTLIRPYDDAQVIAGQGTCGLEIAGEALEAGVTQADVLTCGGGGGLTAGIALAGNLFTLFVFYEILTLVTYPLVIHRGTPAALAAGRKVVPWRALCGLLRVKPGEAALRKRYAVSLTALCKRLNAAAFRA